MNMKTLKLLSFASLFCIGALAPAAEATAARPTAGRALPRGPLTYKPDLRCSIQAFEDAAGMKPVANGQQLAYGGGAPKLYVRVVLENAGKGDAKNFDTSVSIKNGGINAFSAAETLTIPGGLAKMYPLVPVNLPGTTNKVVAKISADTGSDVSEFNESNNSCTFTSTIAIVH
jgi:hypothetical protein